MACIEPVLATMNIKLVNTMRMPSKRAIVGYILCIRFILGKSIDLFLSF